VFTRIAVGRARVVREVRAAGPLTARLRAPVTARGPWLTAVLNAGAAGRLRGRPVAVVVEAHAQGRPEAVAFLEVRRRGPLAVVGMLGGSVQPVPGGRPPARLPAGDPSTAALLADGIVAFLGSLQGSWTMRLAGLPLGDPTVGALADRLPTSVVANERSSALVDRLDEVENVVRSRDPALLERWLPALLASETESRSRAFLRAAARLHAAIGQVELAVVAEHGEVRAALLTLVDGADRWPWWGTTAIGGLGTAMGSPLVGLSVPARRWPA
jgi:hypothetical protein